MTLRRIRDADVGSTSLAARFVCGPHLAVAEKAKQRLSDWLSDLASTQAAEFEDLFARFPHTGRIFAGIAEASPYLFDLVRSDAARALRILQGEPDLHLARLFEETRQGVWTASNEAQAMQILRRAKSEAALLIALCDIGGVWPVMQVTRALTDFAVISVQSALHFLLQQEATRGRIVAAEPGSSGGGVRPDRAGDGQDGRGRTEFFQRYRPDRFLRRRGVLACARHRAAAVLCPDDAGVVAVVAAAQRRGLRVPGRSAAASRSGLDAARDLNGVRLALLRARRPYLGTRRHDQGEGLCGRRAGGRSVAGGALAFRLAQASGFCRACPTCTT